MAVVSPACFSFWRAFVNMEVLRRVSRFHIMRESLCSSVKANSHHTEKQQQTSLLEFVGSVCYPCWRWLEMVRVCFHPN